MKLTVTFKDPDALHNDLRDAVALDVENIEGLDEVERDNLIEARTEAAREDIVRRWFEYGEYVTIEIDTEAKTARVVPRSEK